MEQFIAILKGKEIFLIGIVFIIIIILALFSRSRKKKKYLIEMNDYEVRYNSLKSIPLSFKLNKAVAIARLDEKTMQNVARYKDDFEMCQSNLKQIATMLADTEDLIHLGKLKMVKDNLTDLGNLLDLAENQVGKLNAFLDTILEKESAQRAEVTKLKDRFRTIKKALQEKSSAFSYCWEMIENKISDCEKKFTAFEEWMYASEFEKASVELKCIEEALNECDEILTKLPDILQKARGFVPSMIEEVSRNYTMAKKKGVYLDHLEVQRNLEVLRDTLNEDLAELKKGTIMGIEAHLEDYTVRLNQLDLQIKKESASYDELLSVLNKAKNNLEICKELQVYIDGLDDASLVRFGLADKMEQMEKHKAKVSELENIEAKIEAMIKENSVPSSTVMMSLKELVQDEETLLHEYSDIKERIEMSKSDEERARKQLLKLQLIMNEMQVKINKNRLPSISDSYHDDLNHAYEYVESIQQLLNENPLNVTLLNSLLNEAIDFIYKLYNNVNNLVGMAIMVENTIVFGNKYRSSYPEIDSELTRAELCYRNGEYTQALTIAIATIEKIFPENYEQMIKENAKSAA